MLARWSSGRLVGATVAYWAALAAATLGGAVRSIWRVTHDPALHGSISASFENGLLSLRATEAGRTVWSGATTPGAFLLVAGLPPFLLVLAWLWARGRARRGADAAAPADAVLDDAVGAPPPHPELDAGKAADWGQRREREGVRPPRPKRAR